MEDPISASEHEDGQYDTTQNPAIGNRSRSGQSTNKNDIIHHHDHGADISSVHQMFNRRSVFITGASGFIGRVLLEKLLRTYEGIERVYILLRPKKNLLPLERLHKQLLNVPIFDHIKSMKNGQELLDKIVVVAGDISEKDLGISAADMNTMLNDESLSIVFHSAATVKFDEPLKTSVQHNVVATKTIIELCKRLKNLVCLCHVSTAYVNSDLRDGRIIEEKVYPMKQDPQQVIEMAEMMDENSMQQMKADMIGERPNTYTYTKALSEHLIAKEAASLPVAIVRPSIVVGAWKEPLEGWVDNLNGPTGLILAIGKGLLRTMYVGKDCKADMVPVDVVANTLIAAGYHVAKRTNSVRLTRTITNISSGRNDGLRAIEGQIETGPLNGRGVMQSDGTNHVGELDQNVANGKKKIKKELSIFHCTSGDGNPITWGEMESMFPIIRKYPSEQVLRYPFGTFKNNKYHDLITRLFVHYLPALIIDLLCLIMGKKRQLLSIYYKLHSAVSALSHFTTTNYNFKSDNYRLLVQILAKEDRQDLYIDIRHLNWTQFWHSYTLGAR